MELRKSIENALSVALKNLGIESLSFKLDIPQDLAHGDYTSNIALVASQKLHQNPMEVGQKIKDKITLSYPVERIEVVKPGFINFWLSKDYVITQLQEVLEQRERFGMTTRSQFNGIKIMVEFTDPNPFKEFHIGHLYSNTVGESLSRLLESQGAMVWRVTYQGDVGLHVAKALYGILQGSKFKVQSSRLDEESLEKRAKILGEAYAMGSKAYEEDDRAKKEIIEINKKVYEGSDPQILELYQKGRQWSLEYFEAIYKRLGSKFIKNYFESAAGPIGLNLVKDHIKDGVFKESEGAIIFEGEKYGLHSRVFINSLGLPTYEAKDMALPQIKYKDFPYDESIIITAVEQSDYFEVILKALSLINPDLASKTRHIAHGVVRLLEGKMSSRTGNVITGEWLLDEAKKKIQQSFKDVDQDTAEKIAVGAVKYALLKSGIGKDIAFSFEESVSLEGNSGPYLQYTYARTQSVLTKFKTQSSKLKSTVQSSKVDQKLEPEEILLLRLVHRFPEVVQEATEQFAPHALCNYLFDLAQAFNLFYQKHKILGTEAQKGSEGQRLIGLQEFRVVLTEATGQVLKNGLHLLGIAAPERM